MNYKGLIVAALLLATPLCAIAERGIVSNSKEVTFSIISPKDGSLWIATESHGLIRLGATGRTFAYSSATGDFPCDSILALAFSKEGVLYMKDARGDVYSYTTLNGFTIQKDVPAAVQFEVPSAPDSEISQEESNLPTPYRKHPTWPYWVIIAVLAAYIIYLRFGSLKQVVDNTDDVSERPEPVKTLKTEPKEGPKVILEAKPELNTAESTSSERTEVLVPNSDFVARVEELVAKNFTDPGYSVETLADSLGITRVHLNRKLKEAGAPAPKLILKKARMEKALAMLREGLSIGDVYAACGFSSASYFSSAFKEYFGYTPSDVTKPNL